MANFHRLTVPSYNGGLPAGYDYVNNALSGTPAAADDAQSGGINAGTYLVAFGEQATSSNTNRGLKALAQNTDYLDNLLHQDLAVPADSGTVTSAGDTTYTPLTPGVFVGKPGTPNTTAGISTFVKILDTSGNEIEIPGTGQVCQVTSISGATVGTNFAAGAVTFNISPAIPAATQYHVVYAVRSNLANLPVDAFTAVTVQAAPELPAQVEDFEKQISRMSGGLIQAIIGSEFETPDGTRLSKAGTQSFDVDMDLTVGGTHFWQFRKGRDNAGVKTLFKITDQALVTGYSGGGFVKDTSMLDYWNGAAAFSDSNLRVQWSSFNALNFTDASAPGGALLFLEQVVTSADVSGGFEANSLLRLLNRQWVVTVGDGANSFGDFNGTTAIQKALNRAAAHNITNVRILAKTGGYTFSDATPLVIPTNTQVIIEGVSRQGTVITSTATAASPVTMGTRGRLELKTLSLKAGATPKGIDFTGGSMVVDDCYFELPLAATDPLASSTFGAAEQVPLVVKNSRLYMFGSNANQPGPTFGLYSVGAQNPLTPQRGFLVENCTITCTDNNPLLQVGFSNNTPSGDFLVTDMKFVNCQIDLGTAGTTSGNLTGNSGVLDIDCKGATTRAVRVRGIEFNGCHVTAGMNTNQGSSILLHVTGVQNADNAGATSGIVESMKIVGGRWECSPTLATHFSCFTFIGVGLHLENVTMVGTTANGGLPTSDVQTSYNYLGFPVNPPAQQDWAQFVIHTIESKTLVGGAKASLPNYSPAFTVLRNVKFVNFGRDTGCGDLWLIPSGRSAVIDGVTVKDYVDTSNGLSLPHYRVALWGSIDQTEVDNALCNITVRGANSASDWCATTFGDNRYGYCLINPIYRLHLYKVSITGFSVSSAPSSGVPVFQVYSPQTAGAWGAYNTSLKCLRLEQCHADGGEMGLNYDQSVGSSTMLDMKIIGGDYSNNQAHGINIVVKNLFHGLMLQNVSARGNGGGGLVLNGDFTNADDIIISNNLWRDNTGINIGGTLCQAEIAWTAGTLNLGYYVGNHGNLHLEEVGGAAAGYMKGTETSFTAATGTFATGANMLFNGGLLKTP